MVRQTILPWALADVDLGDDVVEVGAGYGAVTDVLAETVPHLTAVEIDEGLASRLRDRFAGRPGVVVVHGDGTALNVADGRFSGAACFTMLHHVPTEALQDRLLAELCRVLRPGGVLVAVDSLASEDMAAGHVGDTYNPVDPGRLAGRLRDAGFEAPEIAIGPSGWVARARTP